MKGLNKAVVIISRIAEVFYWVGSVLVLGIIGVTATHHDEFLRFLTDARVGDAVLTGNGFEVDVSSMSGDTTWVFILFFLATMITLILTALIFRNIYLSFKTAAGETGFSEGATPFQPAVIRSIRKIGIFTMAIPVVNFLADIVITAVTRGAAETSVQFGYLVFGLVVLAMSQFFTYGAELQADTEGLV